MLIPPFPSPRPRKSPLGGWTDRLIIKTAYIHQKPLRLTLNSDSLAPYEKRVIELLRNSRDKRARKLAKKRVRLQPRPIRCQKININNIRSSVPSVVPRRRSTSSSVSSLSPVVPATKRILSSVDFRQAIARVRITFRRYLMGISWTKKTWWRDRGYGHCSRMS